MIGKSSFYFLLAESRRLVRDGGKMSTKLSHELSAEYFRIAERVGLTGAPPLKGRPY